MLVVVLKSASVLLYFPQMQYSKSIAPAMLEDCCLPNLYPSEQKGIYQSRDVLFSLCSAKTSFSLMLYGKSVTLSSLGSRGAEPGPFKAHNPHRGAVSKRPMRTLTWQQGGKIEQLKSPAQFYQYSPHRPGRFLYLK